MPPSPAATGHVPAPARRTDLRPWRGAWELDSVDSPRPPRVPATATPSHWRRRLAIPLVLAGTACGVETTTAPGAPEEGILTVTLDFDREAAARAGADSALVRVRSFFLDPSLFSRVQPVALDVASGRAEAEFRLPVGSGYYVAAVAYVSGRQEVFAAGELDQLHAAVVTAGQRRSVSLSLSPWTAAVTPPPWVRAEHLARYDLRFTGAPPMRNAFFPAFVDGIVADWGIIAALRPWSAEDRPAPLPVEIRGASTAGPTYARTYHAYHRPERVPGDTVLYVQGFFDLGGPGWHQPGQPSRTFRLYTAGPVGVPLRVY